MVQNSIKLLVQFASAHLSISVFGRPYVKRFALCYLTVVCLSCHVCDVGVLWQNGWMDQDETWHGRRPRPRRHCVRWRPSSPQKGHSSSLFSVHVNCGQTVAISATAEHLLWLSYEIGKAIIFFPVVSFFFYLSLFPRLISAVGDWMSAILLHMVWQ